jgi:hypothetical protein
VRLLEAVSAPPRLAGGLGRRLGRIAPRLGPLGPGVRLPVAIDEALPLAAVAIAEAGRAGVAVTAERTVGAVMPLRTIRTIRALRAFWAFWALRPLAALVCTLGPSTVLTAWLAALLGARLRLRLMLRRLHEGLREAVVARHVVVAGVVEALAAYVTRTTRQAMPAAIHTALVGLAELVTVGHDDAVVVLSVLQIVLRQHWVSGRLGVARER